MGWSQDFSGTVDLRVHVDAKHGGSEVIETNGTNGGTGPVSSSANIPLLKYKVTASPITDQIQAAAEGEVLVEVEADDPGVEGDQTQIELKLRNKISSWATPVLTPWSDIATTESRSFTALNYKVHDWDPVSLERSFRYTLTWRRGRNVLAPTTENERWANFTIDGEIISEGPFLGRTIDNGTVRISQVFTRPRDPDPEQVITFQLVASNEISHHYPALDPISLSDTYYYDFIQSVYDDVTVKIMNNLDGTTEQLAIKPDEVNGLVYAFNNVPSGLWYDPVPASGFLFEMLEEGLLFNRILDFPGGYDSPFTVSVDGEVLGQFGPGQPVDFVTLLGTGVASFTISGIEPYAQPDERSGGFAVQLDFNEQVATFRMSALQAGGIAPGRMLSPVGVTESGMGTFSPDAGLVNMINGSGLSVPFISGATSFDLYFSGNPLWHQASYLYYWQSDFSADGNIAGTLDFDLGAVYSVDALGIWNGTLKDIVIWVADAGEGPWQSIAYYQLTDMQPLSNLQFDPQVLQFPQPVNARFIRIEVQSVHPYSVQYSFRYAIAAEVVARVSTAASEPTSGGNPEIAVFGGDFRQVEILSGDETPDSTDTTSFGSVATGATRQKTFRIANLQPDDGSVLTEDRLLITAITTGSDLFEIVEGAPVEGGSVIIPEESDHLFTIRFAPTTEGPAETWVEILHNDTNGNESPFSFKIAGTGVQPLPGGSVSLKSSSLQQQGLIIRFEADPGGSYQVLGSSNLTDWLPIYADWLGPQVGSGEQEVWIPLSGTPEGGLFFRIEGNGQTAD